MFSQYRLQHPDLDYRDWQPAKWQSLDCVRRRILDHTAAAGHPVRSVLELGCGSATLLIQFALHGVPAAGIDRDADALALAADSLASLADRKDWAAEPAEIAFRYDDFWRREAVSHEQADLVMSIGVAEHFDPPGQQRVLRLHGDASRRWVLIAVPNLDSPLFQTFLRARALQGTLYDDDHLDIDVPALAEACGYQTAIDDGCHLFLSNQSDRHGADAELAAFDAAIRAQLAGHDPERFAAYPEIDLRSSDVAALAAVEEGTDPEVRRRFGFLRWYLLERAA